MKKYVITAIAALVFLGLAGLLTGLYLFNKQHADLGKTKPDFKVSAFVLLKEFEDNETYATSIYLNKTIEVAGTVSSIKTGEDSAVSIILKTGSDFSSVICTLAPGSDISGVMPGSEVTIRGECSGFLMDVLLNNCAVIK